MELFAVGARIFFWFVVFVLLLFSASALQLGMLGFLVLGCTWLAFFFEQIAVRTHAVR